MVNHDPDIVGFAALHSVFVILTMKAGSFCVYVLKC